MTNKYYGYKVTRAKDNKLLGVFINTLLTPNNRSFPSQEDLLRRAEEAIEKGRANNPQRNYELVLLPFSEFNR